MDIIKKLLETDDYTSSFTKEEIDKGKAFSLVGYFWILFFIPLLIKDNKYCKFHANQGLNLFIFSLLGGILVTILSMGFDALSLNIVSIILKVLFSILILFLLIIGVYNVLINKSKELPIIGNIRFIK